MFTNALKTPSQSLTQLDARSCTLGSARPTQKSWTLDHRSFASFAQAVIKRCTNWWGGWKRFTSGHGIAGTVSGVEAAIHCNGELWLGVVMEVSERDHNLAIHMGRNGPGAHLESRCRWGQTSFTSNFPKVIVKLYYHESLETCYEWCTSPAAESEPPQITTSNQKSIRTYTTAIRLAP